MKENDIQVADIEKELARLSVLEKTNNPIQACLFNLIVYVHDKSRIAYLQTLTQSIVERFPCRILFIHEEANAESNFLKVNVSHEVIGNGKSGIACEQIAISSSESQKQRIPFIVLPNLVPDLPIYFLWGQDPSIENKILPYLEKYTSRLIFDTECAKDFQKYCCKVLEMIKQHPQISFVDINWIKLGGWRQAFRQIFDCTTHASSLLNPQEIVIKYNNKKSDSVRHHSMQALYLVGWLASRLQWQFVKAEKSEGIKLQFNDGEKDFRVILVPEENQNLAPGDILGVELSDNEQTQFSMEILEKQSKVIVHISTETTCELPFVLSMPGLKKPIPSIRELFFAPLSPHYTDMLKAVTQIRF